jgi:hypothetical protein
MEMSEVTKNTADRDMEGMQMDDCQGNMKENLEKRKKKKN